MTVQLGDIVSVEMRMTPGTSDILNTFYLGLTGPGAVSDADALDDLLEVFEALALLLKALIATAIAFDRIRAINITQDSDLGVATFATTTAGAVAGGYAPLQVAGGTTFYTARLASLGRKFWGGVALSLISGTGFPTATATTAMGNVAALMLDEYAATNGDWRFGIVSTLDQAFLPLESAAVSTTYVTQRRRRAGVGS